MQRFKLCVFWPQSLDKRSRYPGNLGEAGIFSQLGTFKHVGRNSQDESRFKREGNNTGEGLCPVVICVQSLASCLPWCYICFTDLQKQHRKIKYPCSFFQLSQPAWVFVTLLSLFIASLLALGQSRGKDGSNREDFQKKQGRNVKWSAIGSHILSAEWRSPLGVLKKAVSASPLVDSCRAPVACIMRLSFS